MCQWDLEQAQLDHREVLARKANPGFEEGVEEAVEVAEAVGERLVVRAATRVVQYLVGVSYESRASGEA